MTKEKEKGTPIRCECGKLIAIRRNGKLYIRCRGCKREVEIKEPGGH